MKMRLSIRIMKIKVIVVIIIIIILIKYLGGLPWWLRGKESTCQCRRYGFDPWVRKILWRRKWQPLQYSCLGYPMDKGAWWSTIHGIEKESNTTEAT